MIFRLTRFLIHLYVASLVLPIMPFRAGAYNPTTNLLFCTTRESCTHEIGHMMDTELGYISTSHDFSYAIKLYVASEMMTGNPSKLAYHLHFSDEHIIERYANLYADVDGDISRLPQPLQQFYSDSKSYQDMLDCLMASSVAWCGRGLRIGD